MTYSHYSILDNEIFNLMITKLYKSATFYISFFIVISMNKEIKYLSVPTSDDFTCMFGCEVSVDPDTIVQECSFYDDSGKNLILAFGLLDRSFSISIWNNNFLEVSIRSDYLQSVDISDQGIDVVFTGYDKDLKYSLKVWPHIVISMLNLE